MEVPMAPSNTSTRSRSAARYGETVSAIVLFRSFRNAKSPRDSFRVRGQRVRGSVFGPSRLFSVFLTRSQAVAPNPSSARTSRATTNLSGWTEMARGGAARALRKGKAGMGDGELDLVS